MESSNIDKCVALFGFEKIAWLTDTTEDAVFKWTVAASSPSAIQAAQLNATILAFQAVKRGADGKTAQLWLAEGRSPVAGFDNPLDAIRAGEGHKVIDHINRVIVNMRSRNGSLFA